MRLTGSTKVAIRQVGMKAHISSRSKKCRKEFITRLDYHQALGGLWSGRRVGQYISVASENLAGGSYNRRWELQASTGARKRRGNGRRKVVVDGRN